MNFFSNESRIKWKLRLSFLPYCDESGHLILYTLLVPGLDPLLPSELNYSWHRFKKVLKTFLRDCGPYWHDLFSSMDVPLELHLIPKVLYWIEIWRLWRPLEFSELLVMFKKPVW